MSEINNDLLQFDETASLEDNFLQGKSYAISSLSQDLYQQITLRQGAFYNDDFKIVHAETNTVLTENVDFQFSYFCSEIHRVLDKFAFAGIILLNKNIYGNLLIDARFVGGDYGQMRDNIVPSTIAKSEKDNVYLWEEVEGVPSTVPVGSHDVSSKLLTEGFGDMVLVLKDINQSIKDFGTITPDIPIDWVIGLQEALDKKVENGGQSQINRVAATLPYPGYVKITLPEMVQITKTALEFNIFTKGSIHKFAVGGKVAGSAPDTQEWAETFAKVLGVERTFEIYTGYTANRPCIFIGPFNEASAPEKLLVSLNQYLVDGLDVDFSPEFELNTVANRPEGYTNVTNRYQSNGHEHEIEAIVGLSTYLTGHDDALNSMSQTLSTHGQTLTSLGNELDSLSQSTTQKNNAQDNSINELTTSLGELGDTVSSNEETAQSEYQKVAANEQALTKIKTYLKGREQAYTATSGSELLFNGGQLNQSKTYVVTLVGSQHGADIYRAVVRYVMDEWVSGVISLGRSTDTSPILNLVNGKLHISCFDSTKSDNNVLVLINCIDTLNKPE